MAILSSAEALLYLPQLSSVGTSLDDFIARAEGQLAAWARWPIADGAGRPNLEQATYTFYLDGPAFADFMRLDLPIKPIQSITSIHDDPDREYGASTLVAASDYETDDDAGEIYLLPNASHSWNRARRTIRVIGVFGLNPADDHQDIKHGIALLAKHFWDLRHTQGNASVTQGPQSRTRREEGLPVQVKQAVARLRMWGAEIA